MASYTPNAVIRNTDFASFSKEETKIFFCKYVLSINDRIRTLTENVNQDILFNPSFDRESLSVLYSWFANQIYTRPASEQELSAQFENLKSIHPFHTEDAVKALLWRSRFTDQTLTIIEDVGLYFGETLRRQIPILSWGICTTKRSPYYNMPVIIGFSHKKMLSPQSVLYVLALNILDNKVDKFLCDLYDTWSSYI
jgi:hypothetical protein